MSQFLTIKKNFVLNTCSGEEKADTWIDSKREDCEAWQVRGWGLVWWGGRQAACSSVEAESKSWGAASTTEKKTHTYVRTSRQSSRDWDEQHEEERREAADDNNWGDSTSKHNPQTYSNVESSGESFEGNAMMLNVLLIKFWSLSAGPLAF